MQQVVRAAVEQVDALVGSLRGCLLGGGGGGGGGDDAQLRELSEQVRNLEAARGALLSKQGQPQWPVLRVQLEDLAAKLDDAERVFGEICQGAAQPWGAEGAMSSPLPQSRGAEPEGGPAAPDFSPQGAPAAAAPEGGARQPFRGKLGQRSATTNLRPGEKPRLAQRRALPAKSASWWNRERKQQAAVPHGAARQLGAVREVAAGDDAADAALLRVELQRAVMAANERERQLKLLKAQNQRALSAAKRATHNSQRAASGTGLRRQLALQEKCTT